jgi:uncharacterized protein YkwD
MKRNLIIFILITLGLAALLRAFVLPRYGMDWAAILPAVVATLTNDVRSADNIGSLNVDPLLTKAAQAKAEDMAAKGYFNHISPDGTVPWFWMLREGYLFRYAGENLAVNFDESGDVVEAWLASPSHRLNIMKREYTDIGIGMATGTYQGRTAVFVVQMFGTPARKADASTLAGECLVFRNC